jgi:hypothetical protein
MFMMLGIPVILSKITFSQIIADNKMGGTSVICNLPRIAVFCLSSDKYLFFASYLSEKNGEIIGTKNKGEFCQLSLNRGSFIYCI